MLPNHAQLVRVPGCRQTEPGGLMYEKPDPSKRGPDFTEENLKIIRSIEHP
jgi:hypothetical protein